MILGHLTTHWTTVQAQHYQAIQNKQSPVIGQINIHYSGTGSRTTKTLATNLSIFCIPEEQAKWFISDVLKAHQVQ